MCGAVVVLCEATGSNPWARTNEGGENVDTVSCRNKVNSRAKDVIFQSSF